MLKIELLKDELSKDMGLTLRIKLTIFPPTEAFKSLCDQQLQDSTILQQTKTREHFL